MDAYLAKPEPMKDEVGSASTTEATKSDEERRGINKYTRTQVNHLNHLHSKQHVWTAKQ